MYFIDTRLEYDAKNVMFRPVCVDSKAFTGDLKVVRRDGPAIWRNGRGGPIAASGHVIRCVLGYLISNWATTPGTQCVRVSVLEFAVVKH